MDIFSTGFEELLERCREVLAGDSGAEQAVAVLTAQGNVRAFANHSVESGNAADEEAFIGALAAAGENAVQKGVCMWRDGTPDVPSAKLRKLLAGLDKSNAGSQFLLYGEGPMPRTLGSMQ